MVKKDTPDKNSESHDTELELGNVGSEAHNEETEALNMASEARNIESDEPAIESEGLTTESEGLNTELDEPAIESEALNMESEGLNMESEGHNTELDEPAIESEGLNMESERHNTELDEPAIESEGLNIESEGLNMESEGLNMESEGLTMESEGLNMESEGLNMESEGVDTELDEPAVESEGLNMQSEELGLDSEVNMDSEGLAIESQPHNIELETTNMESEAHAEAATRDSESNVESEETNLESESRSVDAELSVSEPNTTQVVVNQHYDESLEVNDSEEISSPTPRKGDEEKVLKTNVSHKKRSSTDDAVPKSARTRAQVQPPQPPQRKSGKSTTPTQQSKVEPANSDGESDDDEESSGDDDDGDEDNDGGAEAMDTADFEHLSVSRELKELFQYINRYIPPAIELEYNLKPFNPDYIPAVGDIDAFLKVPRADDKPSTLGLTVLDEPCSKQSDPTVLDLQLRNISKTAGLKELQVRSVADAENNQKAIDSWIESIDEIHRGKPAPTVHYQKKMPDIDTLMTEWPPEIETLLKNLHLPTADLDCSLQNYADIICSILDIPVHNSKVHSLHLLFSLYSAFQEMQHFQMDTVGGKDDNQDCQVLHFE